MAKCMRPIMFRSYRRRDASRIASIVDDDDTHLVDYQYLGRQSFVAQESLS